VKESFRYIVGYLLGFSIFILLVPWGLYKLSHFDYLVFDEKLIDSDIIRYALGSLLFAIGAVFAVWSNIFLFYVGKGGPVDAFGISISPQTKKLVTTGPYKYTRNPMVFGAFSVYISLAVFYNSIACLIGLSVLVLLLIALLKLSEEKRLLKDFGNEYLEYKKRVPMIFPIKRLKK
jgi:protein-S-isoprenylcysteine O-methyltransferase Ste14